MRVACIGASVAGLGTALELLKLDRSVDVTLFDKKPYVGANTVCGGAISSFMLRELKMKLPRHVVASEITTVRIYAPNGEFWELDSEGESYGYVLWREKFERHLAEQVAELSGKVRMHEIKGLNGLSEYDYIVGADGLTGITNKILRRPFPPLEDVHVATQRISQLSQSKDAVELYFGSRYAPKGYAWIFPSGYKKVRIGLGVPLSLKLNPSKLLDRFMEELGADRTSKAKSKLIPTTNPPKKLVYGNVILVGDAAHLCDPLTGGGIANAVLSGKYAAKAIVQGKPEAYDSYCRGLKCRNLMRYRLKRILYDLSDEDFNEMIDIMKGFQPNLTRISWAIAHAILTLGRKKPKLFTKHRVFRRLMEL